MESLYINIKFVVRLSVLTFTFVGLIACKENEGFSAAQFGADVTAQGDVKKEMTPEALEELQNRLLELGNIEEDISLKDKNITKLQADIEDLKLLIKNSEDSLQNSKDSDEIEELKAGIEAKNRELEVIVQTYNEFAEDRIAKDNELLKLFSDIVSELSKYETTEASLKFQKSIAEKLQVYETEREGLADLIIEKQQKIDELDKKIKGLETNTTPEAVAERAKLTEELVETQTELNEKSQRLSSLENLVETNICTIDPSRCETTTAEISNSEDTEEFSPIDDKTLNMIKIGEEIVVLQQTKQKLKDDLEEINVGLRSIEVQLLMNNPPKSDLQVRVKMGLEERKTKLLEEKSQLLGKINEFDRKISFKARQVVSQ